MARRFVGFGVAALLVVAASGCGSSGNSVSSRARDSHRSSATAADGSSLRTVEYQRPRVRRSRRLARVRPRAAPDDLRAFRRARGVPRDTRRRHELPRRHRRPQRRGAGAGRDRPAFGEHRGPERRRDVNGLSVQVANDAANSHEIDATAAGVGATITYNDGDTPRSRSAVVPEGRVMRRRAVVLVFRSSRWRWPRAFPPPPPPPAPDIAPWKPAPQSGHSRPGLRRLRCAVAVDDERVVGVVALHERRRVRRRHEPGCAQPNLTANWVNTITGAGWKLMPDLGRPRRLRAPRCRCRPSSPPTPPWRSPRVSVKPIRQPTRAIGVNITPSVSPPADLLRHGSLPRANPAPWPCRTSPTVGRPAQHRCGFQGGYSSLCSGSST